MSVTQSAAKRRGTTVQPVDWVARARSVAPLVAEAAGRIEEARQVPADVMAALHEAELFRMTLPGFLGGGEVSLREVAEVLEIVAAADASTAWCLGQALGCAHTAGFVDRDTAREIFGAPDAVLAWGALNATGRADVVPDGYRVTGEWNFASGSRNAQWLGAHCFVYEPDGSPRRDTDGQHVNRTVLFPIGEARIIDRWQVMGLRGTGSDSYAVDGLFVPEAHGFLRDSAEYRRETAPIFFVSTLQIYAVGFSAVALGIARAMLDDLERLAIEKVSGGTTAPLCENPRVQAGVATAEGKLASARAYLHRTGEDIVETIAAGETPTLEQRAHLRIAATFGSNQAREVAEFVWQAAGSTAIFDSQPYERRFRDMHAVSQQVQAHLTNLEAAGRALLGLPAGSRV